MVMDGWPPQPRHESQQLANILFPIEHVTSPCPNAPVDVPVTPGWPLPCRKTTSKRALLVGLLASTDTFPGRPGKSDISSNACD